MACVCVHLLVFFLIKVSRPICAFDLPHYILHSLDNRGLDVGRRKRKARTGACDKATLSLRSRNGSLYLGWKIKKKKGREESVYFRREIDAFPPRSVLRSHSCRNLRIIVAGAGDSRVTSESRVIFLPPLLPLLYHRRISPLVISANACCAR